MSKARSLRTQVPASFFVKLMLPFVVPFALTFILVLTVGNHWPRTIPPGSGLKFAGLIATAMTCVLIWWRITRTIEDKRAHAFAALFCAVTALMGWPVWTMGVLPSVNGFQLGSERSVGMMLERTETTPVSRSRKLNHWAWLKVTKQDSPISSGRYFISEQVYSDWSSSGSGPVNVTVARGLLGAEVVIAYTKT